MTMCGAFSPLLLMSCATNLIVGHLFSSQGSLSSRLRKTRSKGRSPRTLFMNTFPNWRWFKSQKFRQISSPFWSGCVWLGTKSDKQRREYSRPGPVRLSLQPDDDLLSPCPRVWGSGSACLQKWQMTSETLVPSFECHRCQESQRFSSNAIYSSEIMVMCVLSFIGRRHLNM